MHALRGVATMAAAFYSREEGVCCPASLLPAVPQGKAALSYNLSFTRYRCGAGVRERGSWRMACDYDASAPGVAIVVHSMPGRLRSQRTKVLTSFSHSWVSRRLLDCDHFSGLDILISSSVVIIAPSMAESLKSPRKWTMRALTCVPVDGRA